jgi:hypothetical protein
MSDKIKVEVLPVEQGATPDPNNANKHTQRGRGLHENSMRKRGAGRSIFSAGKGVTVPVTMGGNQTLEIAETLGMEIINVHTTGQQVVNVVRDDIEPGSAEFYAMAIEDNEIGKQSYNPDIDVIAALTVGDNAVLASLRDSDDVLRGMLEGIGQQDAFTPNVSPTFSTAKVLDSDVVEEKARLDNRFKEGDEYLEVICPHCAKEFFINKKDVK